MKQNLHTHSIFCDGKDTIEEMVRQAIQLQFSVLGFSGHGNSRNIDQYSMEDERVNQYIQEVRRIQVMYQDQIQIYCGIEQDALGRKYDHKDFDYIIGSVHYIPVKESFGCIDQSKEMTEKILKEGYQGDYIALAQAYYEEVMKLAEEEEVDIIGHLDLLMKFNEDEEMISMNDERYLKLAYRCIDALIAKNKIFEVNTGAMARGYRLTPYPHQTLLRYIHEKGGRICLNSDCHDKHKLDHGFVQAMQMIRKCGFTHLMALGKEGFYEKKITDFYPLNQIVECVPNYSISTDEAGIQKILEPFINQENVYLVNAESDVNYNRTVVTVMGEPQAVKEAMVLSVQAAEQVIDLNKHHGEHLRMGAADVIPFIPLRNMSLEETIQLSEQCAQEIYESTQIPVFLYNLSAKRKQCEKLPDIRKGEFEGMKEKLKDPMWHPDFGSEVHPTAGVCAVGARQLLVAYNIDLDCADIAIADAIAKAIRFSSGGYRYVQARSAFLKDQGRVQVTVNLTDFHKTALYRVFEAVQMEAKRYDVQVIGSEIIGLVSLDCLKECAAYYLKKREVSQLDLNRKEIVQVCIKYLMLHDFDENKIIETMLEHL